MRSFISREMAILLRFTAGAAKHPVAGREN